MAKTKAVRKRSEEDSHEGEDGEDESVQAEEWNEEEGDGGR